jgi:8-hydroxy-5-deazaflavin:NADPH oxidoreductase
MTILIFATIICIVKHTSTTFKSERTGRMAKTSGILGTGMVGRTIAAKLMELGYQVKIGTRDVASTMAKKDRNQYGAPSFAEWHSHHQNISVGSFNEAATFGELIFLCTLGAAALDVVRLAGSESFKSKTVIDISNPLDFSRGMPPFLIPQFANTYSLAEEIQKVLPEAHLVKTLNIVNCEVMVNARKSGGDPTMFVAGNNAEAKEEAKSVLKQFGWTDIIDLGDITGARGLEMLLPLWLRIWQATQNGYIGFKIIR